MAGNAIDGMDRFGLTMYFNGKSDFVRSVAKVVETKTIMFSPETPKVKKVKKS
jgi:hypothetical protein